MNLEKLFIIGYQLSAVHDELHKTDGIMTHLHPSGHDRWFHGPFPGGWETFYRLWEWDTPHESHHWSLKRSNLKRDKLIVEAHESYVRTYRKYYPKGWHPTGNKSEFREDLQKLHETLKNILLKIINRIERRLVKL
jgi:hypothetical protein